MLPGRPASARSSGWCSRTSASRHSVRSTRGTVCRSANGGQPAAPTGSRSSRLRLPPGAPLLALSASAAQSVNCSDWPLSSARCCA
jgi:hypothetical protein